VCVCIYSIVVFCVFRVTQITSGWGDRGSGFYPQLRELGIQTSTQSRSLRLIDSPVLSKFWDRNSMTVCISVCGGCQFSKCTEYRVATGTNHYIRSISNLNYLLFNKLHVFQCSFIIEVRFQISNIWKSKCINPWCTSFMYVL